MSDAENLPELDELEPIEEATPAQSADASADPAQAAVPVAMASPGLAPPASNPAAGKQYYRFLFAGLVMLIGCCMPFGQYTQMDEGDLMPTVIATYGSALDSFAGGIYLIVALGMVWSWWGAIHRNKFSGANLKWVGLCLIPLMGTVLSLMAVSFSWGDFFSTWSESFTGDKATQDQAGPALQAMLGEAGIGRLMVFLGAILAEVFFIQGVFGGAKHAKAQKQAKMEAAGQRRRR